MVDIQIETAEVPHIGGTSYAGFAVRAHASMIEEGQSDSRDVMVVAQQSAIIARIASGETIGILTFLPSEASNTIFLYLAYVVPDYRRRGVFRLMHDELVKAAERRGVAAIESVSMISNTVYRAAVVSAGSRVVAQVHRMDLV